MGREPRAESRKKKQEIRKKLKAPKCPSECPKRAEESPRRPKTGPIDPKMIQNETNSNPRRPQEESKRANKANLNRKTKKGPNQDDPKTVLDPTRVE